MRDLTQGSITKTIIAMAAPVAAGMIFQTLYLLVDLYFVAALGDAAVAGVGSAGTAMFMIMAITQILAVSTVALMSQAVGRKDQTEANLVFNQSMLLSVGLGVLTLVIGLLAADFYMAQIAADGPTREQGTIFLRAFIPGMSLQFAMMAMSSALRATGIVKPGMLVQMVTVVLNTILAPILIAGWGPGPALGVFGAGLASSISVTVGILILVYYFIKQEKYVKFDLAQFAPDTVVWKRMFAIGAPAGGEMLLMFIYFAVIYVVIQDFGAEAQAGFSIGGRIMQSIFMPTMAVAFAIGPIIGQNFGAGRLDRVKEACKMGNLLNGAVMLLVTILVQINPQLLMRGFTDEPAVLQVGGDFLAIVSFNFIAQGVVFSCSGIFQGLGNTRPALLSSAVRLLVFIPVAFLVSTRADFELHEIWYVSVVAVLIQAILSYVLVQREIRLKIQAAPAAQPVAA
ncbi:MAG: MATE family efflux transporter [Pseudomonadota bacterium]